MYYHYTSIEAFYNIVRSGNVWFCSLAFMNDEMEGFDLHEVLTEVLDLKYGSDECQQALKLVDTTINTYLRFQMSFSASTLKDDISQWRAYTELGQGVCIEFSERFISNNEINKVNCLYDYSSKKQAIINDRNLKANDGTIDQRLDTPEKVKEYVNSIIKTLVSFKNSSFSPEKEVRWVYSSDGVNDPVGGIKYRPHRLGLSTYKEVAVNLAEVKSITIGPQVPRQNLRTFEDFVIENNCSGFITKSAVTLR